MSKDNKQKAFNRMIPWIIAARPKTLWAALVPVALSISTARCSTTYEYFLALVILLNALLIQILTNFINDYIDGLKGTDAKRVGPTRVVSSGILSPQTLKRGIYICFFLCVLLGLILVWQGGWPILLIGLLGLFCALWYSYGPLALSYHGLADLFVFVFFGPIATLGTYFLLKDTWSYQALVLGIAPGLISTAVLTANNARDYETDLAANKKTLAVRCGLKFAKFEYFLCLLGAIFLPLWLITDRQIILASFLTLIFAIKPLYAFYQAKTASDFMPLLPMTAKLLAIYLFGYLLASYT